MSRIYAIVVILILSGQASFLFAEETPDANDGGGVLVDLRKRPTMNLIGYWLFQI